MSSIVATPWYNIEICSNLHTLDKFKDDHVIAIIDQNINVDLPDGFIKIHLEHHGEMIKSYEYFNFYYVLVDFIIVLVHNCIFLLNFKQVFRHT